MMDFPENGMWKNTAGLVLLSLPLEALVGAPSLVPLGRGLRPARPLKPHCPRGPPWGPLTAGG